LGKHHFELRRGEKLGKLVEVTVGLKPVMDATTGARELRPGDRDQDLFDPFLLG
jgi:hypothetical protein